jgi:pimeloyl-ACP methyl ester carboxylesterase
MAVVAACASDDDRSGDFSRSVDIGGRSVYLTCQGQNRDGESTIALISGYHDSSDVWTATDVLDLRKPAVGPPVLPALAGSHRVCAYDRPGTLRYVEGTPLTDRSTPVAQPRTANDLVAELHDVLAAAAVPAPYVVVGHSLGGLIARAYAQKHADQVRGVVFVDAFSASIPAVFGTRWAAYRDHGLNPPVDQMPVASMRSPDSERVDLDASIAEVLAGPSFPKVPVAVLTKTEPFVGLQTLPGLTPEETNRLYEKAQDDVVALAPARPQTFATGSDHYIQFSQPDLVVQAAELIEQRTRP